MLWRAQPVYPQWCNVSHVIPVYPCLYFDFHNPCTYVNYVISGAERKIGERQKEWGAWCNRWRLQVLYTSTSGLKCSPAGFSIFREIETEICGGEIMKWPKKNSKTCLRVVKLGNLTKQNFISSTLILKPDCSTDKFKSFGILKRNEIFIQKNMHQNISTLFTYFSFHALLFLTKFFKYILCFQGPLFQKPEKLETFSAFVLLVTQLKK